MGCTASDPSALATYLILGLWYQLVALIASEALDMGGRLQLKALTLLKTELPLPDKRRNEGSYGREYDKTRCSNVAEGWRPRLYG